MRWCGEAGRGPARPCAPCPGLLSWGWTGSLDGFEAREVIASRKWLSPCVSAVFTKPSSVEEFYEPTDVC